MKIHHDVDASDTMYPARAAIVHSILHDVTTVPIGASIYGYVMTGKIEIFCAGVVEAVAVAGEGMAFCVPAGSSLKTVSGAAKYWAVSRFGFIAPLALARPEQRGRLSYIDSCSDSLLFYPPRRGDGSMSLLYFPPGINQTWHTHPSIRLGLVISGDGVAEWRDEAGAFHSQELLAGDCFMLNEHQLHRFSTRSGEHMRILAYHPDGDWGPEDHNHTMLNRTYVRGS